MSHKTATDTESNTVTISIVKPYVISNITYISGSLEVSTGSTHDPSPQVSNNGSEWTITLDADRNGTAQIANDYNTICGGDNYMITNAPEFDTSPGALNFFFGLNMTIELVGGSSTITTYLGQGHDWASRNNWWIGGSAVRLIIDPNSGTTSGHLLVNDTTFLIAGGISSFDIDNLGS